MVKKISEPTNLWHLFCHFKVVSQRLDDIVIKVGILFFFLLGFVATRATLCQYRNISDEAIKIKTK